MPAVITIINLKIYVKHQVISRAKCTANGLGSKGFLYWKCNTFIKDCIEVPIIDTDRDPGSPVKVGGVWIKFFMLLNSLKDNEVAKNKNLSSAH